MTGIEFVVKSYELTIISPGRPRYPLAEFLWFYFFHREIGMMLAAMRHRFYRLL